MGGRAAFKKAVGKDDWPEVLRLGPGVLKANPWDAAALCAMAAACDAREHQEVGLRYLRNALTGHPTDAEVNRRCAKALGRAGQFDQAIACWRRVQAASKDDAEAGRMISQLMTDKTTSWSDDGENDQPPAAAPDSRESAKPSRKIPLTKRQQLEQAILQRPGVVESYYELADHFVAEENFYEALRVLNKALEASGSELSVRERLEDVMIQQAVHKALVAEQRAQAELSEEAFRLAQRLRDDLNRLELDVFQSRCERYPQDASYRLKLAVCLKRAGNFSEAAKLLDGPPQTDELKPRAVLELGECQQHMRQYAEALRSYREALELTQNAPQQDLRKRGLYRAGVLTAALKEHDSAEAYFRELTGLDPDYKDAAARLDKIEEIRHKG